MSLKPDDFPVTDDGSDAFLHGIVITFDGTDEWSLYDDPPAQHAIASVPVAEATQAPNSRRAKDKS